MSPSEHINTLKYGLPIVLLARTDAARHQSFVGAGYFNTVQNTISDDRAGRKHRRRIICSLNISRLENTT